VIDTGRHIRLACQTWDAVEAQTAVDEIVADARARLDPTRFWPAHPQDDGAKDGDTSLYMGATGVIWALDHLARIGATRYGATEVALRDRLVEAARQKRAWHCQVANERTWKADEPQLEDYIAGATPARSCHVRNAASRAARCWLALR